MGSYGGHDRISGKRASDSAADLRIGNTGDDDDAGKMSYPANKSRKFSSDEDADVSENSGRRRACLGRNSSGSSRWSSDGDDDHETTLKRDSYRENISDCGRECETPRYGRDKVGNEWPHQNRHGCKKEARAEAVKTSSNCGMSNENYDVIEIRTTPLECRKAPVDEEHAHSDCRREDGMNFHSQKAGIMPGHAVRDAKAVQEGRGRSGQQNFPMAGPFGFPGANPVPFDPAAMPTTSATQIPANAPLPPFSPHVLPQGSNCINTYMLDPRYSHAICSSSSSATYFNQPSGRGIPSALSGPIPNVTRWIHPRGSIPSGKAPSRGEQNDYSQNFVDTGMRPQNFIRKLELTSVVEDYPRLRELIQKKDEIVTASASPPMYYKCDLREHVLSSEFFGTKFDVILVDPPWEEYVHRAPGLGDHWTFEEILNLKIEAIADTPSFIFLWVGDGIGLEQGRQCFKKWGFRRCEDICWVKTNKTNASPGLRHDSHTLFQRSKEHCLMGIKGTVRRSTDGHIIHANIDTDVIVAEEPPYGSTAKPEDMYRIIEHFSLGRRRLELFGEDHNIRAGWLTLGRDLSSSNFDAEVYVKNFADNDGKVWEGGGGRNPPPEAPHLVLTTPEIESLRPKSPMKNQYQIQQEHSLCIPVTAANTCMKFNGADEASNSNPSISVASLDAFTGRQGSDVFRSADGRVFDVHHPANNFPFNLPNNGSLGGYDLPQGTMNMPTHIPM